MSVACVGALVEYLLQPGITHAALSSALVALLSKVAHDEQGIPLLAGFALRLREHDGVSGAEMLAKWRAIGTLLFSLFVFLCSDRVRNLVSR